MMITLTSKNNDGDNRCSKRIWWKEKQKAGCFVSVDSTALQYLHCIQHLIITHQIIGYSPIAQRWTFHHVHHVETIQQILYTMFVCNWSYQTPKGGLAQSRLCSLGELQGASISLKHIEQACSALEHCISLISNHHLLAVVFPCLSHILDPSSLFGEWLS
jgi:hypothetical protein